MHSTVSAPVPTRSRLAVEEASEGGGWVGVKERIVGSIEVEIGQVL